MHDALLERSVAALDAVRKHISFSANIRNQAAAPSFGCKANGEKCFDIDSVLGVASDVTSWRVFDHCAAVTRTYAIFESFVLQILREYIAFLSSVYTLSALGKDFKAKYTRGVGQILLDQDKQRYKEFNIAGLIRDVSAAMADIAGSPLAPEALLRTEQNFRLTELSRLFSQCGLSGLESWITSHADVKTFFEEQSPLTDTVVSELKQIVDYRNEAAHGEVDNVLGPDVLVEFTYFFEALCRSIADFIRHDTLQRAKEVGRAKVVGIISERFHDDIVIAKVAQETLSVGDKVYVFGKDLVMLAELKSIQINDVDKQTVEIGDEMEVGLRIGVRAKKGCELVRLM